MSQQEIRELLEEIKTAAGKSQKDVFYYLKANQALILLKQQPTAGAMSNQEIIDLFEKARGLFINYNEQDIDDGILLFDQALTLLKQKPPEGNFTKRMRRAYAPKDPRVAIPIVCEYLLEACGIIDQLKANLDSAEARLKELLEVCEVNTKYLYSVLQWFKDEQKLNGHGVCHIISGIEVLIKSTETAISKAKKEG